MKRIGYVIEEAVQMSNLEEAFDTVVRGTKASLRCLMRSRLKPSYAAKSMQEVKPNTNSHEKRLL